MHRAELKTVTGRLGRKSRNVWNMERKFDTYLSEFDGLGSLVNEDACAAARRA